MSSHPDISLLTLRQALRADPAGCVAFVGAGGKTSAMFILAGEIIHETGKAVFVTTTTHMAVDQAGLADWHFLSVDDYAASASFAGGVVLFTGAPGADGRLAAPRPEELSRLQTLAKEKGLALLIEADGSKLLPLKAPAGHEPPIPDFATQVVVVAGMHGLGRPLDNEHVHRVEHFSALSGLLPGEAVSPAALARVLVHPEGGLKNIPAGARRSVVCNQADTEELQAAAGSMAPDLLERYDGVIVANLHLQTATPARQAQIFATHEHIAGIVLAAGEAVRYGQLKQLLPWRGEPLVRHAARAALAAGLSPVVVVAGDHFNEIQSALDGLPVEIVQNLNWRAGQSSSVQAGLRAVSGHSGGAVFLLADQPQVPAALIRALVERHAASLAPIVGPMVDGRRGNPVLFDCRTFPDLMQLSGDTGGRPLFSRWQVEWLPWHDTSPLLDVDTPEDYARLQAAE